MRKFSKGSRLLAMLLVLVMTLSWVPFGAFAEKGDISNDAVTTGLTGNIDTADTISLPIKIYDYENDGMLFEYAEAYSNKTGTGQFRTAANFGATWAADITTQTAISGVTNSMFGNFWSDVTTSLNTSNSYAARMRVTWNENTADNGGAFYGRASVITPNDLGGMAMNNVRYLVLVYRSNVASGKIGFWVERANLTTRTNANNRVGDLTFTNKGDDGLGSETNWTYAVYDLKQGKLSDTWTRYGNANAIFTTLPMDASGEWMDIAHVALFANKAQATAFGKYAVSDGSNRGDNRGFGLLRGSRNQGDAGTTADNGLGSAFPGIFKYNNTSADYGNAAATVYQVPWNTSSTLDLSTVTNLGYTLLGTYGTRNIANIGLLESAIGANGYPVYKEEVVTYMAYLLKDSLEISERTSDGWKNYRYVQGTPSPVYGNVDLATALRNAIDDKTITNGDCDAAAKKNLVGTWSAVSGNISTYHDAAYFLLNSIFFPGSYNVVQDDYDYLVLSAGTDSKSGDKVYVFDGGFTKNQAGDTAVAYNTDANTIQNSDASYKTQFSYNYDEKNDIDSWTTLNPFLPVTDGNTEAGQTNNPYYQDDGVINREKKQDGKDSLYKRDFNFAMVSEGEFVYHADDELFFEFEGDDDVYLFINGELVMDIGSAHSIDSVRFELNDYVNAAKAGTLGSAARNKALALEEGNTYSFKFYYLERHSYGSNIRVCTNIRVTDPSMLTQKTAWQNTQLDFGSIVDPEQIVEYGFAITNNGDENLYNLTFTDNDIGVTLDPTNGLTVKNNGSRVFDVNGGTLEAKDLTAIVSGTNPDTGVVYDPITVTFADNAALKAFLGSLSSDAVLDNGGGLWRGSTVLIRGIGYKLTDAQVKAGVFDNTVLTTSTNKTKSKTLQGQATMRVFVPADPMYYQWADHKLSITKTKLVNDVLAAAQQADNVLNGKVANLTTTNVNKIELVTKAGNAISSPYVTINSSYNLSVNFDTTGSHVFYVKITYNSSKNTVIVPVLVNVTSVQDSLYVLDYGLNVDLSDNNELNKNDVLTVPGRDTLSSIIAIGSDGAYSPNEITFTESADGKTQDGQFQIDADGHLNFLPAKFLEALNTVQIAMNVYEKDISPSAITGTLDINNEVEMYKNVMVLPANVVYYEDCFPAITYTGGTQNQFSDLGEQSNDQDENYGHDGIYEDDQTDADSQGCLQKISISSADVQANFSFTGTGFELIGRTNAYDSATLYVKVLANDNSIVKVIPVINEFDNNDNGGTEEIYQVPVIRVKDLDIAKAPFTVQVYGVPAYEYAEDGSKTAKVTNLYIDGLRIYQPIKGSADEDKYSDTEKNAQFVEIRDEIVAGKVAVVNWDDTTMQVGSGVSTWTENLKGEQGIEFNEVESVDDYMRKGPNNEVYMTGTYDQAALVFYVTKTDAATQSLQIAVRGIDEALFLSGIDGEVNAKVRYGVKNADGTMGWKYLHNEAITSSTEQYYSINLNSVPVVDGKYQIVLNVEDGMVSYSSLKLVGLELANVGGDAGVTNVQYVDNVLHGFKDDPDALVKWVPVDANNYVNFITLAEQLGCQSATQEGESSKADFTDQAPSEGSIGQIISGIVSAEAGKTAETELVVGGDNAGNRGNLISDLIAFLTGSRN